MSECTSAAVASQLGLMAGVLLFSALPLKWPDDFPYWSRVGLSLVLGVIVNLIRVSAF